MNTNELQDLVISSYEKYPQMEIKDMLKLLYQSEFGCGHLIQDEERSLERIREEAAKPEIETQEGDVVEDIGCGLCRLYLRVLKKESLMPETLNRFFLLTANQTRGSAAGFEEKAGVLERLCAEGLLPFDAREVSRILAGERAVGYPAMSHSESYREAYAPAYRVVDKKFCDFLRLFCKIDSLAQTKDRVIVAIDGGSAAGKSTLGALIKSVYSCNLSSNLFSILFSTNLFSMDDFFLQPWQRTPERLNEPGGNVDYQRFKKEVLEPLITDKPFTYKPYDCSTGGMSIGKSVTPKKINIVEGVYSMHPYLSEVYDLKVFLEIGAEEQSRRLLKRNKELYDRFIQQWIPMENKYFDAFKISSRCDLVF